MVKKAEKSTLEIRNLRGDDVFSVLNILGKLELKDELVKVFGEFSGGEGKKMTDDEVQKRGMNVMAALLQQVLRNIMVVKEDINSLLADLTEQDVQEIKDLGAGEYTKLVIALFKNEEIKEVFTSAASLMTDETASTS